MDKYVLKQHHECDEELVAKAAFIPGMFLYGHCCGFFGRDSYGKKQILDIRGNELHVLEKGGIHNFCNTNTDYFSWVDLLKSSNADLEANIEFYLNEERENE